MGFRLISNSVDSQRQVEVNYLKKKMKSLNFYLVKIYQKNLNYLIITLQVNLKFVRTGLF